jgi:hypothetical protein
VLGWFQVSAWRLKKEDGLDSGFCGWARNTEWNGVSKYFLFKTKTNSISIQFFISINHQGIGNLVV